MMMHLEMSMVNFEMSNVVVHFEMLMMAVH